jgi:uncharacterized phage protein (TIGR01671 family)
MLYDLYLDFQGNIGIWNYEETEIKFIDRSDCLILMQYTGLKDKNGVEIYEGDLVAVADYANWEGLYKIIWDEKNLMYMLKDAFGDREKLCEFEEYLVKGNIYENPELLRR